MNTGQTTPNIGIYIPVAGEEDYDQSFASGMVNIDQHDHSGGPNKGLPIATEGLGAFSVTFDKLNANVVDPSTGIGTSALFPNQIVMLDPLKSIFQLVSPVGFLTLNGTVASVRTFQNSSTISWTNANGIGDPSASVLMSGLSPISVANGGTGRTFLTSYAILLGGTTSTGALQQVADSGLSGQVLTSLGTTGLPIWQNLPTPTAQNFQTATLTLTAAQLNAITSTPSTNVILIPAPGVGKVIVVNSIWGKLTYGSVDVFHTGSSVRLYWGNTANEVGFVFLSAPFKDSYSGYYYADDTQSSSFIGIPTADIENIAVTIGINSSSFNGGSGNTVSFSCTYSIMQI